MQEQVKVPACSSQLAVDHEILPAPMTLAAPEQTAGPPFTKTLPRRQAFSSLFTYPSSPSPSSAEEHGNSFQQASAGKRSAAGEVHHSLFWLIYMRLGAALFLPGWIAVWSAQLLRYRRDAGLKSS